MLILSQICIFTIYDRGHGPHKYIWRAAVFETAALHLVAPLDAKIGLIVNKSVYQLVALLTLSHGTT
jgi:hypothetical protein